MNVTEQESYDLEACINCVMLLANRETPTEMDESETAEWLAGMDKAWPESEGWHLAPACGEDCEGGFSWRACGVCGSNLGGDRHAVTAWRTVAADEYLDEMVAAYVECALWAGLDWSGMAEGDDNPEPLDAAHDADDLAPATLKEIREECRQFIVSEARDLAEIDASQAGHDLYLTRNRHGAGFWDRGLGERGDRLAAAARVWGTSELYAGDDGKLYAQG